MARMTKRQLKEDKLLSTTAEISVFLKKYWGHIVGVIVAVAVLIAAAFLYSDYVEGRNEKTALSFNEARSLFDEAEVAFGTEGRSVAVISKYEDARVKFQAVSQRRGNRDTVSKAFFYSARCSYQIGRYREAISTFLKFADKYPGSILAFHVQKAIGNCYEQLGNDESMRKAIQQYDVVLKYPETHATLEAALDKGRCYEWLEEWDKAIAAYKSITDRFKQNADLAIQNKSKALIQNAKEVISKYDLLSGANQTGDDFVKFIDESDALAGKGQWFEALKAYDKAIVSQKELWSKETSENYSAASQSASKALKEYEDLSSDVIRNIVAGRKLEKQGDWNSALPYYGRAVKFDFLPGKDLFDKAHFRIFWINSMKIPPGNAQ